jgi:hypothetical protein
MILRLYILLVMRGLDLGIRQGLSRICGREES